MTSAIYKKKTKNTDKRGNANEALANNLPNGLALARECLRLTGMSLYRAQIDVQYKTEKPT